MANRLIAWIRIQELHKHPTVLLPFLLGTAIAWSETGALNCGVFAIALIATYFITNGSFISNEYFDYETDRINIARIGGDKVGVTSTGGDEGIGRGSFTRKAGSMCFYTLFYCGNSAWDFITVSL